MFHIEAGEAEDIEGGKRVAGLLSGARGGRGGLCVNLELTNEMREKQNCFSSSGLRPACGINYVVHSHIPREVFRSKARRIEGLQKIKKEFINGFLLTGPNVESNSLILDNVSWQQQLTTINPSADFFTFIFLHKKAGADLRLIVESQVVRRLPSEGFCLLNCCSPRFSTSFQGRHPGTSEYNRPQPLEQLRIQEFVRKVFRIFLLAFQNFLFNFLKTSRTRTLLYRDLDKVRLHNSIK